VEDTFNPLSGEVTKTPPFLFVVPEQLREEIEKIENFCEELLLLKLPPTTTLLGTGAVVVEREKLEKVLEQTEALPAGHKKILTAAVSPGIRFRPEQLTPTSFLELGKQLSQHFVTNLSQKFSLHRGVRLVRGKPSLIYGKVPDGRHYIYLSLAVGLEPL